MSNNQLGRSLLEKLYSSRENKLYLAEVPGYDIGIMDSVNFFYFREDLIREHPSTVIYESDTLINDLASVDPNKFYIIKPDSGDPYFYKGSKLSSDNDAIIDVFSKKVYSTSVYNYTQRIEKEIEILDETAQILVSSIELIGEIGSAYEKLGVYSKAADYYQYELKHNSNNPQIRGLLAYVLAINGETMLAREQAEIVLEDEPKEVKALSALAIIESEEYNWKEAKVYAKKAIDYGADDSNVYYAYCEALYKLGELKASQNYFNKGANAYRFNPRREKYKEYEGCPFEVNKIHYCSETYNDKTIIPYDEKLINNKCYYIGFKIEANVLRWDYAKIGVKIYSNEKLRSGDISKDGFTFYTDVEAMNPGNKTIYIEGWGSDSGTYWPAGEHRIELWYKGAKIAEDKFYIY